MTNWRRKISLTLLGMVSKLHVKNQLPCYLYLATISIILLCVLYPLFVTFDFFQFFRISHLLNDFDLTAFVVAILVSLSYTYIIVVFFSIKT